MSLYDTKDKIIQIINEAQLPSEAVKFILENIMLTLTNIELKEQVDDLKLKINNVDKLE